MNELLRIRERYSGKVKYRYSMRYGVKMKMSKDDAKRNFTMYDEKGRAWVVNLATGEQRLKEKDEILKIERDSFRRTKTNVRQMLEANYWNCFVTLTFNSEKQNREDDEAIYERFKIFTNWLRIHAVNAYYIFVPERHKDGVIHFHGLIGGVSLEELNLAKPADFKKELRAIDERRIAQRKKPQDYLKKWHMFTYRNHDSKGRDLYCFRHFCKYGKNEVSIVDNQEAVYGYIMKYISKSMREGGNRK